MNIIDIILFGIISLVILTLIFIFVSIKTEQIKKENDMHSKTKRTIMQMVFLMLLSWVFMFLFDGFNRFLAGQGQYINRFKEGLIYYLYHS